MPGGERRDDDEDDEDDEDDVCGGLNGDTELDDDDNTAEAEAVFHTVASKIMSCPVRSPQT